MNIASNVTLVRVSRVWLSAVAMALMLVASNIAPVTAQSTATVMISNLEEAPERRQRINIIVGMGQAYAHSFHTGSTAVTLEKVRLYLRGEGSAPAVTIRADNSGEPGRSLHALTNPTIDSLMSTHEDLTATGYVLAADTTYWLVLHRPWGSDNIRFSASICDRLSTPEGETTGEVGWSLGEKLFLGLGSWEEAPQGCRRMRMAVYASALTTSNQAANSPATGGPGITGTVQAGETLTATTDGIEDEDGLTGAVFAYQWVRSGADIERAASSTYTVTGDDEGKPIQVRVTFTDDAGNAESLTSYAKLSAPPLIIPDEEPTPEPTLVTEVNEAPVFPSATATRTIPENTPAGRNIGAPVAATDADNDLLTYSLGGPDAASFDIVASSGQLQTKLPLDRESKASYSVTVSVSDGDPDTAIDTTTTVTINVTTTTTATATAAATATATATTSSGSRGGGGGGGGGSTPTPTPTPSPTPTPTPTPTGPQFSGQITADPSVTGMVVPEGATLGLNGGGDLSGGVYVNFPPAAVALPVHVSVSVSNTAPEDVKAPSGTTLLPLTIDITPDTPLTLGEPLTIEINPTPEQLEAAGGDLNNLAVGVVTPHGIVVLPTQVLHGRLVVTTDRLAPFVLVAITDPGPLLTQPPMGDASSMGPLLQWTQPPRTTWFQVQVIPFNEDGPGINLVIGDGAQVQAAQYQVLGPNFGSADPNYVMLPDMTYLWRVRTTTVLTNPEEADWSAWAVSSFKTPPASSSTITPVAPPAFAEVGTLTPTLTWANSNTAVFYYEVQVSKDYAFGPNAFLYSEYVHGGASTPSNSYVVPEAFPLEAGEIYYWRVRPRIQGDGDPLPWSTTYVFLAPR